MTRDAGGAVVAADPGADPAPQIATARLPIAKPAGRKAWVRQMYLWHWISAALSLVGMFLFSITGITLNHASSIGADPVIVTREAELEPQMLARLTAPDGAELPLPGIVADKIRELVNIDVGTLPAEWTADEVYVAAPGPGSDAWVSIDRTSGAVTAERTDRGFVSFINDLHKGRNTGSVWFWFIDVLAVACIVFTITGLLLLQIQARNRPSTWPLVGFGALLPLIIILLFVHI